MAVGQGPLDKSHDYLVQLLTDWKTDTLSTANIEEGSVELGTPGSATAPYIYVDDITTGVTDFGTYTTSHRISLKIKQADVPTAKRNLSDILDSIRIYITKKYYNTSISGTKAPWLDILDITHGEYENEDDSGYGNQSELTVTFVYAKQRENV